tara:strand:+ start:348 stop:515 length:168 start_codon:yes stop_codon:yes gene_type:complete
MIEYIIDTQWGRSFNDYKIKVNICDSCGWRVEDLESRIDLEWKNEHCCGYGECEE